MVSRRLSSALQALLILAIVAMVLGQIVGQPVLLSYVTSGSMSPTMETGDGFVVLPSAVAGPVEVGDVVTFKAKTLHGGSLTTHRVVKKTDRGYITQGDANSFTDQDGSEPPVKDAQIVGQAIQIGESPIVIPKVGAALTTVRDLIQGTQRTIAQGFGARWMLGTKGLAYILLLFGGLLYVGSVISESKSGPKRRRKRKRNRRRDGLMPRQLPNWMVAIGLGFLLVTSLTVSMTVAGGTHEFGVVSAENDAPGARVIPTGGTEKLNYSAPNSGALPIIAYVESASNGVTATDAGVYVPAGERRSLDVKLSAPEHTGYTTRYVTEYRYIAILPRSWIHGMHTIHPLLPVLVIDALVLAAFLLLALPLLGTGSVRPRSTRSPLIRRAKRWLR